MVIQGQGAKQQEIGHRVLRSTASNALGKFLFLLSGFFLTPFILRHLGALQFGLWALVGSIVAYGSLLDLGIGSAIIKYVAELKVREDWDEARSLVATALRLYSVLGLVAMLLTIAIAPFFPHWFHVPPEQRSTAIWLVVLMGSGIALSIPCSITGAVIRGLQRYDVANFLSTIGLALYVLGTVLVLSLGGGLLELVAVSLVSNLLTQIPALWLIRRLAPDLRFGWTGAMRGWVHRVLSLSSWLFITDFSGRVQTRTDEIVIGAFLPIRSITPFTLARRLSEVGQIMTDQFMKVLLPLASELHAEDNLEHLREVYKTGTRITLAVLIPIFCTLCVLSRPLLTVWVGPPYGDYGYLVVILALAGLVDTSTWPAGSILQGIGRPRPLAISASCAAAVNLGLSVLLVKRFGLAGVAVGTLVPSVVMSVGFFQPYVAKIMKVRPGEFISEVLAPAVIPAVPMAVTMYFLKQVLEIRPLFLVIVVFGVGILVYSFGYLTVGASNLERQTYRKVLLNTMRFAEHRSRR
jgi:O-antigen/teichoic acid export membrane protein